MGLVATALLRRMSPEVADFVAKVLAEVPWRRRSDHASNMIPRGAVIRNAIPRVGLIGTKILSVGGALDVTQATDRLLQQNRHF